MVSRKTLPGSTSRLNFVDHRETFGRHIIKDWGEKLGPLGKVLDLGCGGGGDLRIIKSAHPEGAYFGIDVVSSNREALRQDGIEVTSVNIESDSLPFQDGEIDLIMANQVLEHTKEIFWINHEIARVLKVGGHLLIGVPNVLAFHNRVLGLFGMHPTSSKICSAHVRCFSKHDTLLFYRACFLGGYELEAFRGGQFYPFPGKVARIFANLLPSLAGTIFFLFRKKSAYQKSFIEYPIKAALQTNFFLGEPAIRTAD